MAGRVQPYQDFPCIDMVLPAFSRRACDALRDFLEPNGELLPLDSDLGEYYFYNITTIVDALDVENSVCEFWCDPPTTATTIDYFAFHRERLEGLSIFRIFQDPVVTIVTDQFVKRVDQCGLNGFQFNKIWPLPPGVNWRQDRQRQERRSGVRKLKQHTLVIILLLAGPTPSADEKRQITILEDELDAQLATPSLNSPYFGHYEASDTVDSEYRMFLSCPDVDILEQNLLPWLRGLNWSNGIHAMKRYGNLYDRDAREEMVELWGM